MTQEEKTLLEERIVDVLKTVYDPEIPVNIYDLGMIYKIDVQDNYDVEVDMTFTAPNCPAADFILEEDSDVAETGIARGIGLSGLGEEVLSGTLCDQDDCVAPGEDALLEAFEEAFVAGEVERGLGDEAEVDIALGQ